VVYAEVCGWQSLFGSLFVSSMVQKRVFGVLGVLVGKYDDVVVFGVVFSLGCFLV